MRAMTTIRLTTLLVFISSGSVEADTITLSTDSLPAFNPGSHNQGWWTDRLVGSGTNDNFITGFWTNGTPPNPAIARSYFTFDLSEVAAPVTAATLRVRQAESRSPDTVETIGLFDVSTDTADLNSKDRVDLTIFEDLGTGASYGSTDIVVGSDPDTMIDIQLNATALAAINDQLGGYFSIGASLVSIDQADEDEAVFAFSDGFANHLVLTVVPEPCASGMLAIGILVVAGFRQANGHAGWSDRASADFNVEANPPRAL